jgi:hypothetical protein
MSCLLIFLPFVSIAQVDFGRDFNGGIPSRLKFDQIELRNRTLEKIPEDLRTGPFARDCFRFAELETEKTMSKLESGFVYTDWQDLEDYLNKVMKKIMPDSLQKDKSIYLYVRRNSSVSLIDMDFTGKVFINIGLLAEVKDEATLAGFLAIALANFYAREEFSSFLEEQEEIFSRSFIEENVIPTNISEKAQLKLNRIAMIWLNDAGYDVTAYRECWRMLVQNVNNKIKQSGNYLTHSGYVGADKTFTDIDKFVASKKGGKGKAFLIDETAFYKYSKSAKNETLSVLLYYHNYQVCIEKAFKYHIFDVNNSTYIYYIMEAIRQYGYGNPNIWNKLFIVDKYYMHDTKSSRIEFHKMREHLFKKIPYKILRLNPDNMADLSKIEGGFYWEDLKFVTYKEAFLFFYQVGDFLKIPECALSLALSQTRVNVRKQLLNKYLAYGDVKYKDYAQKLFDGGINDSLPKKKLLVLIDFDFHAMQAKEQVFVHDRSENKKETKELFRNIVSGLENREILSIEELKETNLKEYNTLLNFFSLTRIIGKSQLRWDIQKWGKFPALQLDILSPELAFLMEKYQVNSIEFLYCRYAEKAKKRTSIEAYEEVSNMGVTNFLNRKNKSKSLYLMIAGCEIENKSMQAMVFSEKVSLKYKGTAYTYIVNHLKEQFFKRDEALAKKTTTEKK